ncbi:MAG: hypothetical protein LUF02_00435 [Erysipelotrichaceae bacterium]|nr:hypothetical protein [Erysipelotrichaceae bacterium]
MRIFISQGMRDKSDEQILEERNNAIIRIKEKFGDDAEIIDSFFQDETENHNPLYLLGKSIELLSSADIAYFIDDYYNYRGCRLEHECAIQYDIPCYHES